MGYYADGSFTVVFPSKAAVAAALAELSDPKYANLWGWNTATPPTTMSGAIRNVWESDATDPPLDAPDGLIEYSGWVSEKWHEEHQLLASVLAHHAIELEGTFRGEDGAGWAWGLHDGNLVEEDLHSVGTSELRKLEAGKSFADVILSTLAAAPDNDGLARVVKIAALSHPKCGPEMLTQLAHDPDRDVAAAAAKVIQDALSS